MKDMKKPKGRVFPTVSEEEQTRLSLKRNKFYQLAEELGINVTVFDSSDFGLNKEEQKQYEQDTSLATCLLLEGQEIPQDLKERLLKIKHLREKKQNDLTE